MKKVVLSLSVILMFILILGCIDYKAYGVPSKSEKSDTDLINEIAQIEQELDLEKKLDNNKTVEELDNVAEEDITLPDFDGESIEDKDIQVIEVGENELVKLNVKVTDPDKDTVTYSFSPPFDEKGEWQTNYGDAGEYLVSLSANDGTHTTEKKIKVVVNRINVPPIIGAAPNIHVKEGATVTFEPKVTDPNNDPVTVTLSEPLGKGAFITDHTSAGEYLIKIVASDGELEAEKTFKLIVDDVNKLPEMSGVEDLIVKEGEVVTIKPEVTDLDGDNITLTISEPVGNDGVWETTYIDHGEYMIAITASDGKDVVTKKIKLVVEDVNMPPEFVEVSRQE